MKVSDQVRSTHTQDGAVVLHIGEGQIFRLNPVGSRILELLKQGHSKEEIADLVAQQFEADRQIVAADLDEFLTALGRHYLIELDPAPVPPAR